MEYDCPECVRLEALVVGTREAAKRAELERDRALAAGACNINAETDVLLRARVEQRKARERLDSHWRCEHSFLKDIDRL